MHEQRAIVANSQSPAVFQAGVAASNPSSIPVAPVPSVVLRRSFSPIASARSEQLDIPGLQYHSHEVSLVTTLGDAALRFGAGPVATTEHLDLRQDSFDQRRVRGRRRFTQLSGKPLVFLKLWARRSWIRTLDDITRKGISLLRAGALGAVLAILNFLFVLGCSNSSSTAPTITDSSKVTVELGRGVSNVCEVGMNYAQIKRATHDATIHGPYKDSWNLKRLTAPSCVLIPSLGAIGNLGDRGKIELISFYVRPYDSSSTIPGLIVTKPFRGKLGVQISFKNGAVGRYQVEAAFGKIQQGVTNSGETILHVPVESIKKGEPICFRQGDEEELYYPRLGLRFNLERDVIISFGVSKPEMPDERRR